MSLSRKIRHLLLKSETSYSNPVSYWDRRWSVGAGRSYSSWYKEQLVNELKTKLKEENCESVLDVGCGIYSWLSDLPNYLGMDFSLVALKKGGLLSYLYANLAKKIPLPDKSFDTVLSHSVLMHIDSKEVKIAASEIMRVTKKCIILRESFQIAVTPHCFTHDYKNLFSSFTGKIYFVNASNKKVFLSTENVVWNDEYIFSDGKVSGK